MTKCNACGESFAGLSYFEKHRIGPFTNEHPHYGRRCLSRDEMEDMDAAEIDAMVEAHLGEGSANGNGCLSTGGIQDAVSCPVCRQASLQVHPGNPYLFFCPGSMSMASMASGSTHGRDAGGPWPPGSLHPDVLLHSSHCAMDLSRKGLGWILWACGCGSASMRTKRHDRVVVAWCGLRCGRVLGVPMIWAFLGCLGCHG